MRPMAGPWTQVMKASMNDLVARYPDQWNINNMAHIGCRLDKKLTASLMGRMTARFNATSGTMKWCLTISAENGSMDRRPHNFSPSRK